MTVQLDKYYGKWYEIARLPNWFQGDLWFLPRKGVNSTAIYCPTKNDKEIKVTNELEWEYSFDFLEMFFAEYDKIKGKAKIKGKNSLSVSFNFFSKLFNAGKANYYIREIVLDEEGGYLFSVVTSSDKITEQEYAWLLSRKDPAKWTEKDRELALKILCSMESYGVDTENLVKHEILS